MYRIIGKDGQQYGPVTAEQLRGWIAENRANADSLVQTDGAQDWKPLGSFPEFAADLKPPPVSGTMPPTISPPQPSPVGQPDKQSQARTWNMLCHLSALSGYIIPFGNVLGPLLVWQIKKHEFPSVEEHGKAALNFQLTVLIALFIGIIVAVLLSIVCIGFLLIPAVVAIGLCGIIFAIIAGIKANNGEAYRYPWSLTFIR